MEYKYDYYYRRDRSWFRLIVGSFLITGTLWVMIFDPVDLLLLNLMYLFSGIYFIIEGLGYHTARIFGEKFIYISPEKILVANGLFSKGLLCNPPDIASMELWPGKIIIRQQEKPNYTIPLANLSPDIRHQILKTAMHFAVVNKIDHNKHGYLEDH